MARRPTKPPNPQLAHLRSLSLPPRRTRLRFRLTRATGHEFPALHEKKCEAYGEFVPKIVSRAYCGDTERLARVTLTKLI